MKNEIKWHKLFESMEDAVHHIPLNTIYSSRIEMKKICIVHTKHGLSAMEDACPHKLIPLSKGHINTSDEIVCVWHKYCFDPLTGIETTEKNIRPARIYALQEQEDGLYIALPACIEKVDEFSY